MSNNNLKALLHYCIREIIRNTLEHNEKYQQSVSNDLCSVYIAAQRHNTKGLTELAFADNGVGIKRTLLDSKHQIQDDLDALKTALQPGISSLSYINNDE